jgi:hypothetical protein
MVMSDEQPAGRERRKLRFTESGMEADIAYLEAQIALVGRRPRSTYETAKVRACQTLLKALRTVLGKAKMRRRSDDPRRINRLGRLDGSTTVLPDTREGGPSTRG